MPKMAVLVLALAVAGCAVRQSTGFIRADGRAVDSGQIRLALAQCQGEGATAVGDYVGGEGAVPWAAGMMSRSSKEAAVVNACMARAGYLAQ